MLKLVVLFAVVAAAAAQTYEIPSGQVSINRSPAPSPAPAPPAQVVQVVQAPQQYVIAAPRPAAQYVIAAPQPAAQYVIAAPAPAPRPVAQLLLQAAPAPAPTTPAPEPEAKAEYSYSYNVNDPTTGDVKSASETRDGDSTSGSYSLVEPDGTLRTVTYTVEGDSGFKASVSRQSPAPAPAPVVAVAPAPAPRPVILAAPAPRPAVQYVLVQQQTAPVTSNIQLIPAGGLSSSGLGGQILFLQGLKK